MSTRVPYLTYGVFSNRSREWLLPGVELNHEAMEAAAAEVKTSRLAHQLTAMRLVDTFTARQLPLPPFVLQALACALNVTSRWERAETIRRARPLLEDGLAVGEISRRLDVPEATLRDRLHVDIAAPLTAQEAETIARAHASVWPAGDGWRLVVTAMAFSERGEPLPYWLWWATACALGLAYWERGLRDVAVKAISGGLLQPDRALAAARIEGEHDLAVALADQGGDLVSALGKVDGGLHADAAIAAALAVLAEGGVDVAAALNALDAGQVGRELTAAEAARRVGADRKDVERWRARPSYQLNRRSVVVYARFNLAKLLQPRRLYSPITGND